VNVAAGRASALELTVANATAEAIEAGPAGAASPAATDTSLLLRQRLDSVVQVWTPTAHGSGFLVDAAGLIVTNQQVVGDATSVEVQLSRSVKVAGTVLEADRDHDVAVVRRPVGDGIDQAAAACVPRTGSPPIARGQEIFALALPPSGAGLDVWNGEPRRDAFPLPQT
jgi:S1-C subfamily serine protease